MDSQKRKEQRLASFKDDTLRVAPKAKRTTPRPPMGVGVGHVAVPIKGEPFKK